MIKPALLFLLSLFVFASVSPAQTIHSFQSPMGSLADAKKSAFSSLEAGFSIELPKRTGGFSGVRGISYNWRLNEGYFTAGVVDRNRKIENTADFEKESLKVLDETVNDFAREYFSSRVEHVKIDKNEAQVLGHQTIGARILFPQSVCIVKVFWIENRGYITGVLLAGEQQKFEDVAVKALDSLKPIIGETKQALFKKLLDENTPEDLPQVPAAKLPKTDRDDNGLKGNIKAVLQESEWLEGKRAGTPREKDSEHYFDVNGHLLKDIRYSDTNGFPSEITVYGFVAGKRVSRSQHITFESSVGGMLIEDPPSVTRRRDPRYDSQYVRKYDARGRRIESILYDNAGRIWTRTVCSPGAGTTSCVLYDSAGKVNRNWTETQDDRGNELESVHADSPLKGWTARYNYKYEQFDEAGNWIQRTMTLVRIFGGVEKKEWVMREYRKITYFP